MFCVSKLMAHSLYELKCIITNFFDKMYKNPELSTKINPSRYRTSFITHMMVFIIGGNQSNAFGPRRSANLHASLKTLIYYTQCKCAYHTSVHTFVYSMYTIDVRSIDLPCNCRY